MITGITKKFTEYVFEKTDHGFVQKECFLVMDTHGIFYQFENEKEFLKYQNVTSNIISND